LFAHRFFRPMLFVHCRAHRRLRANTSGKINDSVEAITIVATVSNCFVPWLPGAHALCGILTETVFERSASVDIIRVSAGVTVMVESKQQAWTKQSLPQRYLCVGCQLKSDQAIRSLCLKGHDRARGSTLWRHRWQEASESFCTKTPLFGESWATKNIAKNPQNALPDALLMSCFQNFAQSMIVQSARIAYFRGNSILFPPLGGSKFLNIIWSPIHVAAHSIPSLANSRFPGQPHAHWACVQGQGHCVA